MFYIVCRSCGRSRKGILNKGSRYPQVRAFICKVTEQGRTFQLKKCSGDMKEVHEGMDISETVNRELTVSLNRRIRGSQWCY